MGIRHEKLLNCLFLGRSELGFCLLPMSMYYLREWILRHALSIQCGYVQSTFLSLCPPRQCRGHNTTMLTVSSFFTHQKFYPSERQTCGSKGTTGKSEERRFYFPLHYNPGVSLTNCSRHHKKLKQRSRRNTPNIRCSPHRVTASPPRFPRSISLDGRRRVVRGVLQGGRFVVGAAHSRVHVHSGCGVDAALHPKERAS